MTVTILSEAKAMDGFLSEHGLSFLLEVDGRQVLFDTGASDVFCRNARSLGLDLTQVDQVILSHGHWDHGNGLECLRDLPLLCHPECFTRRYHRKGSRNLGLTLSRLETEQRFQLETSRKAVRLSQHLWFLGEVPRDSSFENASGSYRLEHGEADMLRDDSGLACVTDLGLVVISGCAHAGIVNMVEHARQITSTARVRAVLGGFHLKERNAQVEHSLAYFRQWESVDLYPSHCTTGKALEAFHLAFGKRELRSGMRLEF